MSKRINISVPDAEYIHWQDFKKQCRKNRTSVSKELMKFVKNEVKADFSVIVESSAEIPAFLK